MSGATRAAAWGSVGQGGTAAPGQVTNLALTVASSTELDLTWDAAAGATSYLVEQSANGTTGWASIATPGTNAQTVTGLSAGTQYFFRVSAVNAGGTGTPSAVANAYTKPAQVGTVTITVASSTELDLTWVAITSATSYLVERSPASAGTWTTVGTPATNALNNTGLTSGTSYDYRVSAVGPGGTGTPSATATGHPFYPLDLSPALWLKSDAGTFQERTGASATTPASADGDPVGSWLDQSGNARHPVAPTAGKSPTLKLAIQNGRSVVRFDGVDDFLTTAAFQTLPAKRGSLFAVYKRSAATGYGAVLATWTAATGFEWMVPTSGAINKWYDGGATRLAAVLDTTNFTLGAIIRDGDTTAKHYRNAALADSFTVTNNQQPNAALAIGAISTGADRHTGDLAEILIFDTALSTSDRQSIEAYLDARWAIY